MSSLKINQQKKSFILQNSPFALNWKKLLSKLCHYDVPNDLLGPGFALKGNDDTFTQILQHSVFEAPVLRQILVIRQWSIQSPTIDCRVESGRRGSQVGAHPRKGGNRWWERCQVLYFVLFLCHNLKSTYYGLLMGCTAIDHPQERSQGADKWSHTLQKVRH